MNKIDLGLYRPMKQLEMAMSLKNVILLPGDLHIEMAELRAIGKYVELTGIPEMWVEAGLYSSKTVEHILDGKPTKINRSSYDHLTGFVCSILGLFFAHYPEEQIKCQELGKPPLGKRKHSKKFQALTWNL